MDRSGEQVASPGEFMRTPVAPPAVSPPGAFSEEEFGDGLSTGEKSDETVENDEVNKARRGSIQSGPLKMDKSSERRMSSLGLTFWGESQASPLLLQSNSPEESLPENGLDSLDDAESAVNTTTSEDSAELLPAKSDRGSDFQGTFNLQSLGTNDSTEQSPESSLPCAFPAENLDSYIRATENQASVPSRPSHLALHQDEELQDTDNSLSDALLDNSTINRSVASTVEVVKIGKHRKPAPPEMDSVVLNLKKEGRITDQESSYLLTLIGAWHHEDVDAAFAGVGKRASPNSSENERLKRAAFEAEQLKSALEEEVLVLREQISNSNSKNDVAKLQEVWHEKLSRATDEIEELEELCGNQLKDIEARDQVIHNVENRLADAELEKAELTRKLADASSFEIRLQGSEEDARTLQKKLDDLVLLHDKVCSNLRASVEESARVKADLEIEQRNAELLGESETRWKDRVVQLDKEVDALREKMDEQSLRNPVKESGDEFLERLSAQLKTDAENSTVANLTETIEELTRAQAELESVIQELREDLRGRDREIEAAREEHKQAIKAMEDRLVEQHRKANQAALVSQESTTLDDSIDFSASPAPSIHGDHLHQDSILETACSEFDRLVGEKNALIIRNKEMVTEVEEILEKDQEEYDGRTREIESGQRELFELMEAQEALLGRLAAENKHLMRQQNQDRSSSETLGLLESHVAELRTLWQGELTRNAEMRRVVMDNPPAVAAAAQQETSALRVKCERFETQLAGVSTALADQQRLLDSWVGRISHLLQEYAHQFVALEDPKERIEVTLKSVLEKFKSSESRSGSNQLLVSRASALEEIGQNLLYQKRALLWISAFNGGSPPQVHHAGCVLSGTNKFRAAVVSILAARRFTLLGASSQRENSSESLLIYGGRSRYPHVPRPQWQETGPPSIHASLAVAALPKVEAALSLKTARIEELECALGQMHVRLAEAEGRSQGAVKAKDSVVATLMEERDRLTEALEREYAETRKIQQTWEGRLRVLTEEQDDILTRLEKERRSREAAEARVERYRARIREREAKYEAYKSTCINREEQYKAAVSKLRTKLEMANTGSDRISPLSRNHRDDDEDDLAMIRQLLGKQTRGGLTAGVSRSPKEDVAKRLASELLERQGKAGSFLEKLIRSAEEDLAELETNRSNGNETVCEQLRDHIEGLRRAAKRLRTFRR